MHGRVFDSRVLYSAAGRDARQRRAHAPRRAGGAAGRQRRAPRHPRRRQPVHLRVTITLLWSHRTRTARCHRQGTLLQPTRYCTY